jgi:hypothetical protein
VKTQISHLDDGISMMEPIDLFDGVAWPLVRCGLLGRDSEVRGGTTLATPRERPALLLSESRRGGAELSIAYERVRSGGSVGESVFSSGLTNT